MTLTLGDGIAWLEAQPPDSLDGIFTDPPWGVDAPIRGEAGWLNLLGRLLTQAARVVRPKGHTLLWYPTRTLDDVIRVIARQNSLRVCSIITVLSDIATVNRPMPWQATSGIIFALSRTYQFPVNRSLVLAGRASNDSIHPCEKPPSVVGQILREWFAPGQVIADPFAGSDTTGWAAERIGLTCYSFEIDPVMYATAITRHAQQDLFVLPVRGDSSNSPVSPLDGILSPESRAGERNG